MLTNTKSTEPCSTSTHPQRQQTMPLIWQWRQQQGAVTWDWRTLPPIPHFPLQPPSTSIHSVVTIL